MPERAWVTLKMPPVRLAVWVLPILPVSLTIFSEPCSASISEPVGIWRASVRGTNPWPLLSAAVSPAPPSDLPGGGLMIRHRRPASRSLTYPAPAAAAGTVSVVKDSSGPYVVPAGLVATSPTL